MIKPLLSIGDILYILSNVSMTIKVEKIERIRILELSCIYIFSDSREVSSREIGETAFTTYEAAEKATIERAK